MKRSSPSSPISQTKISKLALEVSDQEDSTQSLSDEDPLFSIFACPFCDGTDASCDICYGESRLTVCGQCYAVSRCELNEKDALCTKCRRAFICSPHRWSLCEPTTIQCLRCREQRHLRLRGGRHVHEWVVSEKDIRCRICEGIADI